MIVERSMTKIKPFCGEKVVELVKEAWQTYGFPNAYRIYRPISGPEDVVYTELEFKDWQEREQVWAAFRALPEMPGWVEKWKELTETGGRTEFSTLVE